MKPRIAIALGVITLVTLTVYIAKLYADQSLFHPPQTEAEKAADEIVRLAISEPKMFPIVLRNPRYDLSKVKELERLFTREFLVAWRRYEKMLVDRYCGGTYALGKVCGYGSDENPISCPKHLNTPLFYRTVMGDDREAVITLAPADDSTKDHNIYYMHRDAGGWRMGGLYCEVGDPDTIPAKRLMNKFRRPILKSEIRLEKILQVARTHESVIPFILELPWRDPDQDSRFTGLFTPALLRAWKMQAEAIVKEECPNGYYETGKGSCRPVNNPISCRIGKDDLLQLRMTVEDGEKSIITYSFPGGQPQLRFIYRLIKYWDEWTLDGVDCDDGLEFNMLK